ncbi:hook-length control protein FliK [Izhakiella capsodis]|uniref:Hook-length control protein FliK n=1 Tax=Izhakiella capsodis TaxID=1367852 RepID=A0A1I5B0T2_9GAMM|nr:flagellar hook-length control protein FliK [Izhakiella capsodis]SFN68221.1 hook-length control protein FliK [Izhakiella capsodis]
MPKPGRHQSNVHTDSDDISGDPAVLLALLLPEVSMPSQDDAGVNLAAGYGGNGELVLALPDTGLLNTDDVITPLANAVSTNGVMGYVGGAIPQTAMPALDLQYESADSTTDTGVSTGTTSALTSSIPGSVVSVDHESLNAGYASPQGRAGVSILLPENHAAFSVSLPAVPSNLPSSQQSMPLLAVAAAVSSTDPSRGHVDNSVGDDFLSTTNQTPTKPVEASLLRALYKSTRAQGVASTPQLSAALNSLAPLANGAHQTAAAQITEQKNQQPITAQLAASIDSQRTLQQVLGERLQMQIDNQMQKATIRLDPPDLGKLDISLHYTAGKLQVQIHAAQQDVWRVLSQAVPELRAMLSETNQLQVNVQVSQQGGKSRERDRQQEEDEPISTNDGLIVNSPERDDRSVITRV